MRIEWLAKAAYNLNARLAYIGEHIPAAAIDSGDAVERSVSRLAVFPEAAGQGRVSTALFGELDRQAAIIDGLSCEVMPPPPGDVFEWPLADRSCFMKPATS